MASLNSNTRTDVSSVTEIFDTELSDGSIKQHINVAATMVDDIADAAPDATNQRLTLIETYLAAHVAASQDPRVSDESVGDSQFNYKGATDTTDYFETAASLDPSGQLAGDGTMQVGVEVLDGR